MSGPFRLTQAEERQGRAPERGRGLSISDRVVVATGWRTGFLVVEMVKLLRSQFGYGLAEAKAAADRIVAGRPTEISIPASMKEGEAVRMLERLGVITGGYRTKTIVKLSSIERDGWVVLKEASGEGAGQAKQRFQTKKAALHHARRVARAASPSALIIERKDGSLEQSVLYEAS